MAGGLSGATEQALAVEAIFALLVLRRSYRLSQGTNFSSARLWTGAVLYLVLFVVDLAEDFFLFPIWVLGVDAAILLAMVPPLAVHARRTVRFQTSANGRLQYRLPMELAVIYVALFAARVVITLVYAPQLLDFSSSTVTPALSSTALLAVGVVDALFAASTGMLVGRTLGVYLAHSARPPEGGPPAPSSAALPTGAPTSSSSGRGP